ncbi:MAG: chemotaxis protein CheW, partial [Hyphomicrobiales bacterium]|nr:chemotaxis protein CheW [Hyphomicrobiales bacterium]
MADAGPAAGAHAGTRRFLTFRVDERLYALAAQDVRELIRIPPVVRVPQAPRALMGLANLRGSILPLASLRAILGGAESDAQPPGRAIVLDGAHPLALAVPSVEALVSVDAADVETRQAELAARGEEKFQGAFTTGAAREVAHILDLRPLLEAAFAAPDR